jgi:hypothetical protein
MAFGNKVTDFPQFAIGIGGYIIKVQTTDILASVIDHVQAQDDSKDTQVVAADETDIVTLHNLLDNLVPPHLAFNNKEGEVSIFFKGSGADSPDWEADKYYNVGDVIKDTLSKWRFRCVTAGNSGGSEPSWTTSTVITDNEVRWQYIETIPRPDSYPYADSTRFALFGKRKAQPLVADDEKLDVPDRDIDLVRAYAMKIAYKLKENRIPPTVINEIDENERMVREN